MSKAGNESAYRGWADRVEAAQQKFDRYFRILRTVADGQREAVDPGTVINQNNFAANASAA